MKELLRGRNALIAGVGLAAGVIALVLILVSVLGSGGGKKGGASTTAIPQVGGAAETAQLLRGIPQHGDTLGRPSAPVAMIEFADLQCPICRDFAVGALPTVIREYVRPGKLKLVFSGMDFLGPGSVTALQTAYAAALQNKLWNVVDLLYKNQGQENSGWVNEDLLRAVGRSVAGLDAQKMLDDRSSADVAQAVAKAADRANQANVTGTPTFFAGRSGETLQQLPLSGVSSPADFRAELDKLVG